MENKLVLIGTGGEKIGFGHISRLKNLYCFFEKKGFDSHFLVNDDSSIRKIVKNDKISFFDLNQLNLGDYDLLGNTVIIDSYIIPDFQFEKAFHIRIDDFCHLPHYSADIIINPNFGSEKYSSCYLNKTLKEVKLLLGGENVILHPDYFSPGTYIEEGKLAIFLGGYSEGDKHILNLLELCEESELVKKIALVVTDNYDSTIRNYKGPKTIIYKEMKLLLDVIKDAEWGISSAGVTKYEFAALGIPVLMFAMIEHQIEIGIDFEKRGHGIFGGVLEGMSIRQIKQAVSNLLSMSRKQIKRQLHFKGNQNLYDEIVRLQETVTK
ncbi:MAG: hypothetical protein ACFFB5_00525 [Promethearchaeota archaeon]